MADINWKKNLTLAAVGTLGAGLVNMIAGKYVATLAAGTVVLGTTVGGFITVAVAFIAYDMIDNR